MSQYNPDIHHRRSIRLRDYDYSKEGLYFITLCVHKQLTMLGEIVDDEMKLNDKGIITKICWDEIPSHFPNVALCEFTIMPNHIHGIINITATTATVGVENFQPLQYTSQPLQQPSQPMPPQRNEFQNIIPRSIGSIVLGFKIGTTKQIGYAIWQRNYYEHIIRDDGDYHRIAEYIANNPAKWNDDRFYREDMNL